MFSRTAFYTLCCVALIFSLACGDDEMTESPNDGDCPEGCPGELVASDYCPAFADCEEVPDCDDIAYCVSPEDLFGNDNDNNTQDPPESVDCDEPMKCPEGTVEVASCPEVATCTRLTLCDADLICQEVPQMCVFEPLCPEGDRYVDGCDDEACYRHRHCSGPVDCLHCDEELPESCPEGTIATDCDPDDQYCQRVETCEQTLYCLATCIDNPICLGGTSQVDSCDDIEQDCFSIDGCSAPLHCAAPEEECDEEPQCSSGYEAVDLEECLDDYFTCSVSTQCGAVTACLPTDMDD